MSAAGAAAIEADAPPPADLRRSRVLVDLSHAADGYVGVAQDLRLIFAMLSEIPAIAPTGLLMPTARHDLPILRAGRGEDAALTAAVLHCMARNWGRPARRPFPLNLLQAVQRLRQVLRRTHSVLPLTDRGQLNAVWRTLFARTLPPSMRPRVLGLPYLATDLSVSSIMDRTVHRRSPGPKRLLAPGFDFALFCMPRPIALPPGTRQIMRFHDAVPVTDTDTVLDWRMGLAHARLVRRCDPDAVFVCNSPQSLDSLLALDPSRERHACVIPCALAPRGAEELPPDVVSIVSRNATWRALGNGAPAQPPSGWQPPASDTRYVLSVSTLEPRKNFLTLIRAWERRVAAGDTTLRLMIVGGRGWREEEVLRAMRQGVASGALLHLQDVPPDDLAMLMRGAACFAFPSFNEGFGFSPLEAMRAGAPVVVSDLPVFRWVFGDAALYVDPYDAESVAEAIGTLVSPAGETVRERLRGRTGPVLDRFSMETVREEWGELFARLSAGKEG